MFFSKLANAEDRYREIEHMLILPEVISNTKQYQALIKEFNKLSPIVLKYREYLKAEREMRESDEMMRDSSLDSELRELAELEFKDRRELCETLTEELKILLMPKDPNDDKNVIVELRQGAGGEEAALFAQDLYRMYSMYAASRGFRIEVLSLNETELGGIKAISFTIIGEGAYSRFKFESGVHRVQRIPVTESNGRIQTSTVTVAVLPEADEVEVQINPSEIRIESCKSSGAGGQHINKTESAVRLTHIPTGIVIECDQERSQLQNKEKAMRVLYTKLYDMKQREQEELIASTRKSQVGTGERSEKIRTYNYPQSRITDHRIHYNRSNIQNAMNGDIEDIISELQKNEREFMKEEADKK